MTTLSATAAGADGTVLRAKNRIPPAVLILLVLIASLPLLMSAARVLALPGTLAALPGLELPTALGTWLNSSLSLAWIPPLDRSGILYILCLPTAALIITMARLTGGVRVLGFRSILIAIGCQEIGLVPSLLLIFTIVAVILLIRPAMRRGGLPLFARVAVTLGVVAVTMVGGLLAGARFDSPTLFSFAFFPVVILAMLAESIADTVARSSVRLALWRTGSTMIVAGVIAGVSQIGAVQSALLHAPELLLTQIVLVVLVAELFDLRLLQDVGAGRPRRDAVAGCRPPAVAVVRNRWNRGVVTHHGIPASRAERRRSVQRVVDALRDSGCEVRVFEADGDLVRELRRWLPQEPNSGGTRGLVLNFAFGIQGQGRLLHLPAMLEMAGVTYSGPDPLCLARLSDRSALLQYLQAGGIPVPDWQVLDSVAAVDAGEFSFPLLARASREPQRPAARIRDRAALRRCVENIVTRDGQSVVVETLPVRALSIRACLLGNSPPEVLPLVAAGQRGGHKQCPAELPPREARTIRALAERAFALLGCRDYARMDFQVAPDGSICMVQVQVQALETFARNGTYALAASTAGLEYPVLLRRIIGIVEGRATHPARPPVPREAGAGDSRAASDIGPSRISAPLGGTTAIVRGPT